MIIQFCVPPGDGSNSSTIHLPTSCFFIFLDSRKRRGRQASSGFEGVKFWNAGSQKGAIGVYCFLKH